MGRLKVTWKPFNPELNRSFETIKEYGIFETL